MVDELTLDNKRILNECIREKVGVENRKRQLNFALGGLVM